MNPCGFAKANGHGIPLFVQRQSTPRHARADTRPDLRRVLPDAASKDHGIRSPKHCEVRAEVFPRAVAKQIDGKLRGGIMVLDAVQKLPHVMRATRHTEQSRPLV